ncbi:hypothetical protein BH10BAC5_BH10BAC5_19590 [soil metagenome]
MKKLYIFILVVAAFSFGFVAKEIVTISHDNTALKRVTGLGGVFFKSKDPKKLKEWYQTHLGLNMDDYGTSFEWRLSDDGSKKGYTQWGTFKETTKYFLPSEKQFMINYRVADLEALVKELKTEGVTITDTLEAYDYGKFIHIMDDDGNKIELWEPLDPGYEKGAVGITK